MQRNVEALDLALSAHWLLRCCHVALMLSTAAADSILSAAADYKRGILSAVAN